MADMIKSLPVRIAQICHDDSWWSAQAISGMILMPGELGINTTLEEMYIGDGIHNYKEVQTIPFGNRASNSEFIKVENKKVLPLIGEETKIYLTMDTGALYRWDNRQQCYRSIGRDTEAIDKIDGGNATDNYRKIQ